MQIERPRNPATKEMKALTSLFSLQEMPSIISKAFRTNLFLIIRTYTKIRNKGIKIQELSIEMHKNSRNTPTKNLQFDSLEGSHEKHLGEGHLSQQHPSQSSGILGTGESQISVIKLIS